MALQIKLITDPKSEAYKNVIKLGDENSKTLGFLPYAVFRKHSKQKQIIGCFDELNNLLGYLLYRVSYNRVTIVHLCVDKSKRNQNIALELVNHLKKHTKQYEGIRLSCRNDYKIDKVWQKFNFVPINEKPGRSKEKLPLTEWWFSHHQNNLLSLISEYELNNKIVAVIDMNVFIDIKENREKESLALKSDWLLNETVLYYTREIHNEINKNKNSYEKKINRNLLNHFSELPFKDENYFNNILDELKLNFTINNKTDESDLKHLAYSISGGADFFITRDDIILKNQKYFKKFNLQITRPSEFIIQLDENLHSSKYQPQILAGTTIKSHRINVNTIQDVYKFLRPYEKKTGFKRVINDCLSNPENHELLTIYKNSTPLGFIIIDETQDNELNIPMFRFLNTKLKTTISKHVLYKTIFKSLKDNKNLIKITDSIVDNEIVKVLKSMRFRNVNDRWVKLNFKKVIKSDNINLIIPENYKNLVSGMKEIQNKQIHDLYSIERLLYPIKLIDLDIPCFIIPIKPNWAEYLFDDKSEQKLQLFEPQYELLLNRENIYYRAPKPKRITAPARILWYCSKNKTTKQKGAIIGTSYIDEVFIDNYKSIYKKFKNLGIYTFNQVKQTSDINNEVMAFIFSDTELFLKNISIKKINDIFGTLENKKFMALSPLKISNQTYIEFYKLGMKLN